MENRIIWITDGTEESFVKFGPLLPEYIDTGERWSPLHTGSLLRVGISMHSHELFIKYPGREPFPLIKGDKEIKLSYYSKTSYACRNLVPKDNLRAVMSMMRNYGEVEIKIINPSMENSKIMILRWRTWTFNKKKGWVNYVHIN